MSFVIVPGEKSNNSCFKNIINVNSMESLRISWGIRTENRHQKNQSHLLFVATGNVSCPAVETDRKQGNGQAPFSGNHSAGGELKPYHLLTPRCDERYLHPQKMPAASILGFHSLPSNVSQYVIILLIAKCFLVSKQGCS